jgi:hypothetical protein
MEHAESHVRSALSVIGIVKPEVVLAEGIAVDRMAAVERGRMSVKALTPLIAKSGVHKDGIDIEFGTFAGPETAQTCTSDISGCFFDST